LRNEQINGLDVHATKYLLKEALYTANQQCWERERTATLTRQLSKLTVSCVGYILQ